MLSTRHRYLPEDITADASNKAEICFTIQGTMQGWRLGFDRTLSKCVRVETASQVHQFKPISTDIADTESSDIYYAISNALRP